MSAVALARTELNFSERVFGLLARTEYRLATTDEERDDIYRLRYAAYLREGAIVPNRAQRFSDRYDDHDNAWVIGTYIDHQLVSSMRLHVATRDYPDMVAADVFPDEVRPEIEAGKTVIDPTRFVVDPEIASAFPELPYITVRIGHMAAEYFDADIVLATVRAEHQAFYRRVFGHVTVCHPRPYPTLIKPLGLMMLDYRAQRETILRRYPFFGSSPAEQAALFGYPDEVSRRIANAAAARREIPALAS